MRWGNGWANFLQANGDLIPNLRLSGFLANGFKPYGISLEGSAPSYTLKFSAPGSYDIHYYRRDGTPFEYWRRGTDGDYQDWYSEIAKLRVVSAILEGVDFSGEGNHALKNATNCTEDDGDTIGAEWPGDKAMAWTKGSTPALDFKVKVVPSTANQNIKVQIKSKQSGGSNSEVTRSISLGSGSSITQTDFSTSYQLDEKIDVTTFDIQWQISIDDGSNYHDFANLGNESKTKTPLYCTFGVPNGSAVTDKRIEWVCGNATGFGNGQAHQATQRIWGALRWQGDQVCSGSLWKVATAPYQCTDLANFMVLAARMCGLPSGEVKFIYPMLSSVDLRNTQMDVHSVWRRSADGHNGHPPETGNEPSGEHGEEYMLLLKERLMFEKPRGWLNTFEATYILTADEETKFYVPNEDSPLGAYTDFANLIQQNVFWAWSPQSGPDIECERPGPKPEW